MVAAQDERAAFPSAAIGPPARAATGTGLAAADSAVTQIHPDCCPPTDDEPALFLAPPAQRPDLHRMRWQQCTAATARADSSRTLQLV